MIAEEQALSSSAKADSNEACVFCFCFFRSVVINLCLVVLVCPLRCLGLSMVPELTYVICEQEPHDVYMMSMCVTRGLGKAQEK